MTKARDIMTKDVLVVTPDTPVGFAVKILAMRQLSGFPVVDNEKKLLGIISEKDLMGILLEDRAASDRTVGDYMTGNVKTFSPDDDAMEICRFLLEQPFRRIPIVDNGYLVGIVSRADIIQLLWKTKFESKT